MLGKLALRLGADAQCRRIRGEALRKILLQLLQLAKKLIVLRVRYCRTIENVVLVGCAGQNYPQLGGAAMLLLPGFLQGKGRGKRGKRWRLILAGSLVCSALVLPLLP